MPGECSFDGAPLASQTRHLMTGTLMKRRVRVRVNMPALIEHLSREEKREVREGEAVRWLQDVGFAASGDAWVAARESDLGHLDPSEVISVEPVDDESNG